MTPETAVIAAHALRQAQGERGASPFLMNNESVQYGISVAALSLQGKGLKLLVFTRCSCHSCIGGNPSSKVLLSAS
jgi:hypothetical protein